MLEPAIRTTLDNLAKAVAGKKVTQTTISLATGVHQSQVSRILSGEVKRASKNVKRLCNYYNLHISMTGPAPELGLSVEIQEAVIPLVTGQRKSDAALRAVLNSLAQWRETLASHD